MEQQTARAVMWWRWHVLGHELDLAVGEERVATVAVVRLDGDGPHHWSWSATWWGAEPLEICGEGPTLEAVLDLLEFWLQEMARPREILFIRPPTLD